MTTTLGHSGCTVEHLSESFTSKTCHDPAGAARLVRQADKQRAFARFNRLPQFTTPAIIGDGYPARHGYYFEMTRCHDVDALTYITAAADTPSRLFKFARNVAELIQQDLDASRETEVPREIVTDKYDAVLVALRARGLRLDQDITAAVERRLRALPTVLRLPVGRCHGDLTMANMMVNDDGRVTLIDFLDTFLETPLQDICKLRQDTRYLWTLTLQRNSVPFLPAERAREALASLDRRIESYFCNQPFYRYYYKTFQLLNLLRILPYTQTPQTATLVTSSIAALLREASH